MFASAADHEARDILQEDQGDFFLVTIEDKPGGFIG